ncbi:MAG: peptidase T [Ruminococcus sp.]|uniref:peptidase T n=1 Tax=Ruminococcus sp. TaxID=41978 RepID=UPI0025F1BEEF|nr:peptidase T [Ruminococcus sp.]MCR5541096.1 peptidase T [Ruminococcus sp.]
MTEVIERFLRYVKIDTQSDEDAQTQPSTAKQFDLARLLYKELNEMGAKDVFLDEAHCYVYARIPANEVGKQPKTLGFISHMDTSPEASGENVKPRIIEDYDGEDITLNEEQGIVLKTSVFPEIKNYIGQSLIVTDGTTLLGADDKAGVAEIMTMAHRLLTDDSIKHGEIAIAFTPDEEIGAGTDNFDLKRFVADFAYTVDGGGIGELEYETFNAASADITVRGVNVHTGEAKNKMVNAARIAAEFDSLLPPEQKPEFTEGREGFFHLMNIEGSTESATLSYLIRDHDRTKFESKKALISKLADILNLRYGEGTVTAEVKDTYYNMREKIEPDFMFLVENVSECMKKLGIEPKIQPIRGGTDGSSLSFKGLPCPNICTGGHNYHGRYEYCCVESMEKICDLLVMLTETL